MAVAVDADNGKRLDDTVTALGLDQVVKVLGLATSLTAWVVVVGGARTWARFHAAHISASRAVALQSHAYLIAEGLGFLAVPLIVATVAALVLYLWDDVARVVDSRPLRALVTWAGSALWIALGVGVVVALWTFLSGVKVGYIILIVIITVVFLGFGVLFIGPTTINFRVPKVKPQGERRAVAVKRDHRLALGLFAGVALWSGAVGILGALGERHPKLDTAIVRGSTLQDDVFGFLVADSGGDIYVAKQLAAGSDLQIVKVAQANVKAFSFGPPRRVGNRNLEALRQELEATLTAAPTP